MIADIAFELFMKQLINCFNIFLSIHSFVFSFTEPNLIQATFARVRRNERSIISPPFWTYRSIVNPVVSGCHQHPIPVFTRVKSSGGANSIVLDTRLSVCFGALIQNVCWSGVLSTLHQAMIPCVYATGEQEVAFLCSQLIVRHEVL